MTAVAAPARAPRVRGTRNRVLRRLLRNPLALVSAAVLVVAVVIALGAPLFAPYSPDLTDFSNTFLAPGASGHLLGTDDLGRDVLSRIMYGLRASLTVGILAVAVGMAIGIPLGLFAGYNSAVDVVVSRLTDLVLAFPFLILAVGLAAIRGASLGNAAIAIGLAQTPGVVRIVRSETFRLRSQDFVAAAVVDGAGPSWVLGRHVLPNALPTLIVQATVAIPGAILGEAVLSFLGLGIQPPAPSLGVMLSAAQQYATRAPWVAVIPGVAILLVALAFNVFGDALRDAVDPRANRS